MISVHLILIPVDSGFQADPFRSVSRNVLYSTKLKNIYVAD